MIYALTEYGIRCDICGEILSFSMEEKTITAHRGHPIKEDSSINIKKVAKQRKWSISDKGHFCVKCKSK